MLVPHAQLLGLSTLNIYHGENRRGSQEGRAGAEAENRGSKLVTTVLKRSGSEGRFLFIR